MPIPALVNEVVVFCLGKKLSDLYIMSKIMPHNILDQVNFRYPKAYPNKALGI